MSALAPAPISVTSILAATTYLAGTHSFAQRAFADTSTAAEARVDISSITAATGLSVTLEISYDGGTTWNTYTASFALGELPSGSFLGIGIGKNGGLPAIAGRLIRGSFTVAGAVTSTSLSLAEW
jgi:hypothetical protein